MKKIQLQLSVNKPFGNLFRGQCAMIVPVLPDGRVLLGNKPIFYPPTITRLLGGGVKDGESFKAAAAREMNEEINLLVNESSIEDIALFDVTAKDSAGNEYHNETYVGYVRIDDQQKYMAGDDVGEIDILSIDELFKLADRYDGLSQYLWFKDGDDEFCWQDYGKLYGRMHREAAEALK